MTAPAASFPPFNSDAGIETSDVLCSYCQQPAQKITGTQFGIWYRCTPCEANASCHPGTDTPLGTFAKFPLRKARNAAHQALDGLWQGKHMTRGAAYRWLRRKLGLTEAECHIALFDEAQCARVVAFTKQYHAHKRSQADKGVGEAMFDTVKGEYVTEVAQ